MDAIILKTSMQTNLEKAPSPHKRNWRNTLTLFFLLGISIVGWLRMAETLKLYDYLLELGLNPPPLYLIISGGVIGAFFLTASIAQLLQVAWSLIFTRLCAVSLGVFLIIEKVYLSRSFGALGKGTTLSLTLGILLTVILFYLPVAIKPKSFNDE